MHIAICDDDTDELAHISSVINTYRQERKAPITYRTFHNATELLSSAKSSDYSLYFLDVIMPGVNGIEAAREVRSFNTEAKIIFLTSSPEFAVESYAVKAYDYLLKPANTKRIYSVLDVLITEYQNPEEGITLKTRSGITRILLSRLAFVEIISKRLHFHMSDGSVREVTASLSEFEGILLARQEFIRVHRSYIVNLWQVSELTANGLITHAGNNIPVSRLLYSKVRDAYVEQLFFEQEVE